MKAKYRLHLFNMRSANISTFELFMLKIVISLYLLASLYEIQLIDAGGEENFGSGLDPYRKYVQETKNSLDNKTAYLKSERDTTFRQMEEMLETISNGTGLILEKNLDKLIGKLRESFTVAAANNKDVDRCIENSARDVHEIDQVIKLDIDDCMESIKSYYKNHDYFSPKIEEEAMEIYDELNNVFPNCPDFSTRYKCISNAVASINVKVLRINKRFDLHVKFYGNILDLAYRYAQTCVRKSRETANDLIADMIVAADKCVDNA